MRISLKALKHYIPLERNRVTTLGFKGKGAVATMCVSV